MEEQINTHLSQPQIWARIFFMLLFTAMGSIAKMLTWVVIVLQLIFVLFTGMKNDNLLSFGRSLSVMMYHIWLFLTFSTEIRPFPFSPWHVVADLKLPDEK